MFFLLCMSVAHAESLIGDFLLLDYDDAGVWNNPTDATGYLAKINDTSVEFTYVGTPYQAWGVGYTADGSWLTYVANSNAADTVLVESGEDLSSPGTLAYRWTYSTGDLRVQKTEWFDDRDVSLAVQFTLVNVGTRAVENLELLYALDPDQDAAGWGDYTTLETVRDADGDGTEDWAAAAGPYSGVTMGLGACDASMVVLGFFSSWQTETPVDVVLTDPAGIAGDDAMALQYYAEHTLEPGEELSFRFVVGVDATEPGAADAYLALATDVCCDQDGDGATSATCGGDDCDDATSLLAPGLIDVPYDGVDQDCSGADNADVDGDGESAVEAGGRDCNDADPLVSTMQAEVWYDGVDQNCDGNDDDQDLDGEPLAFDCDDQDPSIQTGCPEPEQDTGPVQTSDGCGCDGGAGVPGVAGVLLAMAVARRRRR